MARQWVVFDDWEGGGFFAGGSFNSPGRYNAQNMQRYQNGSIGPRPGWRKMTMSADGGTTVPSNSNKTQIGGYGAGWSSWAPSGWSYGAILIPGGTGNSRRIRVNNDGTAVYFAAADIGIVAPLVADIRHDSEPSNAGSTQFTVDGSNPVYVAGSNKYDPSANSLSAVTPRTISAQSFYPSKLALYKNRFYGWQPISNTALEAYIVYSNSNDMGDFNGNDAGDFRLSVAPSGFSPAVPRGLWALGSGLLIFSSEGQVRQGTQYSDIVTNYADFGRWYILTGQNLQNGTLQPIDYNVGPLFHSLSILYEGKALFPIYQRGWASHDGAKLDMTSLEDLRPGRGQYANGSRWLNPVQTHHKKGLILPFYTSDTDPTATNQSGGDRYGEFWNQGYGAYEFVNGAWSESLYLHGQGDIVGYGNLEHDKLFAVHHDSTDGGATFFPQLYVRDITLDRPATHSSADTYNPFSSNYETAPTNAGAASGDVERMVETYEWAAPDYSAVEVQAIVIDYDYWNGSLFVGADCGFDVDIIVRGNRDAEKVEVRATEAGRVTPPGTSSSYLPKRGRAYINLGQRITGGTVQIRVRDIAGVAIHSIAVAVEPKPGLYV